jgi:hypothetical protein
MSLWLRGGNRSDVPDAETIAGFVSRKNELLPRLSRQRRVEAHEGSGTSLHVAPEAGMRRGGVSCGTNSRGVDMTEPGKAAVFGHALAGVPAVRTGGVGFVVDVDRVGQQAALLQRVADRFVADPGQLLLER